MNITIATFIGMANLALVPMAYDYLKTGKWSPCMHIYFVGVTEYTDDLYELLLIYNLIVCAIGIYAIFVADVLVFMAFVNIPLASHIFVQDLNDFADELARKVLTRRDMRDRLVNQALIFEQNVR